MNREEVVQILSVLKAAFPHSYQKMTKADANAMITLWEHQFADDDPMAVGAAVENLIATRTTGYSPTIGEIKEQLHRLLTIDEMNDSQAWFLVEKACRRGLYNSKEEFDRLPPAVQAAVGGPEQLKAWAAMDADTVNSVVASNFRKTFRTVQMRETEKAMMPPAVKAFIAGISDQMKLSGAAAERKMLTEHKADHEPYLKPLTTLPTPIQKTEPTKEKESEYTPLGREEWERKRNELLGRLMEQTAAEK